MCAFISALNKSSVRPKDCCHLEVVTRIINILECLRQLKCDLKISMISKGDKVTVIWLAVNIHN